MLLLAIACQPVPPAPAVPDPSVPTLLGASALDVISPAPPADPATWHGTVRALTEVHCQGCHSEGGGAPFVIENADDAAASAWAAADGRMPPAQFDPDCRSTLDQRWLDADGSAAFASWERAGFPEGDPADYAAPTPPDPSALPELADPDLVVPMDTPYLPDAGEDDVTVAFYPSFTFADTTWVTGARIQPGVPEMVHHVTVFVVDADGEPVFGDALADSPNNALVAWAPGNPPWVLPEGAAFVVPAGASLRVEVHYSVISMPNGPVPDLTQVELWTRDTPPDTYAFMAPFTVSDFTIPAGDPAYVVEIAEPGWGLEGTLIGVTPHMHLRGAALSMHVVPEAGPERCVLDSPNFSFEFQELHWFTEPMEIGPNDGFRMVCTWNNAADNQPLVNGEPLPVRDVYEGPNTLDEMCQVGWLMTRPYGP